MNDNKYEESPQLNMKKVFAVIVAFIVIIMCVILVKGIFAKGKKQEKVTYGDFFAAYQNDKWGVIDSNGNTIIDPSYAEMIVIPNKQKDVFLCIYDVDYDNNTYKTKALNSKNEEIFTNYNNVEPISNKDESNNLWYESNVIKVQNSENLYGLIDLDGKELLPTEYEKIEALEGMDNTFKITKNGKIGICNENGNILLPTDYSEIESLGKDKQDGFIVKKDDEKYGIVDVYNKQILEPKYDKIEKIYKNDYYVVTENNKQEVVKKDGTVALKGNYDEISDILENPEDGIIFVKNKKYGVMNLDGKEAISPTYDSLKEAKSGVFIAKKNNKFGIIDSENKQLVDFKYGNLYYNGKADIYVAENEKYENELLNSNYDVKQTGYLIELNTDKNYIELNQDSQYKYYNFKFEEQNASDLFPSNTLFVSKKDGKFGYLDKQGNVVVDYIYDDATNQNSYGYVAVKKDGKWGSLDKNGKVVQEPTYNLDDYLKIDFIGGWHLGKDINMNYYRKD